MWASTDVWLHGVYFRRVFFQIKGWTLERWCLRVQARVCRCYSDGICSIFFYSLWTFLRRLGYLLYYVSSWFPPNFRVEREHQRPSLPPSFSSLSASLSPCCFPKDFHAAKYFSDEHFDYEMLADLYPSDFVHLKHCSSRKCELACLFLITS